MSTRWRRGHQKISSNNSLDAADQLRVSCLAHIGTLEMIVQHVQELIHRVTEGPLNKFRATILSMLQIKSVCLAKLVYAFWQRSCSAFMNKSTKRAGRAQSHFTESSVPEYTELIYRIERIVYIARWFETLESIVERIFPFCLNIFTYTWPNFELNAHFYKWICNWM